MPLTNTQFDAVMRRYDEIREENRHRETLRTEQVYREIHEMIPLDDEIASRSLDAARKRIADASYDLTDYNSKIRSITSRKRALLEAHGFDADYLAPVYTCAICHDTGFRDGKKCACFDRIAADILYGGPGLKEILRTERFGCFSFDWYSDTIKDASTGLSPRESAEKAVSAALAMFDGRQISGSLYLYGSTGVGKTFLSHCIAGEALQRGLGVLYFSAGDFFDELAGSAFERNGRGSAVKELISQSDLLVIDDLGTELTNAFTASALFRVINERISLRRSTVISTNLSLKELSAKYSERILSRITSDFTILKLTGDDIRIRKKLNGGQL